MRTILLATAAVLIASPALATQPPTPPPFQGGSTATAAAAAAANANAAANAGAIGIGKGGNAGAIAGGGAGGSASIGGVNVNAAPSLGINVGDNRAYVVSPPGMMAAASGPCTGTSTTGSAGAYVFAIGGGRTEIDPSCTRRETARVLHLLGRTDLAVRLMLAEPIVADMLRAEQPAATAVSITRTAQARVERPDCNGVWRYGVMPAGC